MVENGTNVAGTTVNGTVCDETRAAHCDPTPLLGIFNTSVECQAACASQPNCSSFSFALCEVPDGPFPCHCFGRSDLFWSPQMPGAGIISGRRFSPPNVFQVEYAGTVEAHRRWLWPPPNSRHSSAKYRAFAAEVNRTLAAMQANVPSAAKAALSRRLTPVPELSSRPSLLLSAGDLRVELNTTSGAVTSLRLKGQVDFLSPGHTLAQIMYRTFSGAQETDYTASFKPGGERCWGKPGPSSKQIASRSVRRALLTSQVNPGSRYRCSRRT